MSDKNSWIKKIAPAAALVTAAVVGLSLGSMNLSSSTALETAVDNCTVRPFGISLDDDGKGLFIDGEGEGSFGVSTQDTLCILRSIDVPDSVLSRISNTSALMGQQSAEWDGINASWSYHPDNGLDLNLLLD